MVVLGWYGSDNVGDEAVLQAVVAALRERGITHLHALSINPGKTAARLGIPATSRSLLNPESLRALWGAKALVLGGGGLIQDRTSVYNLPIYAIFVLLARLMDLRVIGWGLGVEPLDTLLGKLLARFICASCIHFSVRDAGSKRLLVRAGVPHERVAVSADPAFLIDPAGQPPLQQPAERLRAVFCLRDLPDNRPGLNLHYLLPISLRRRVQPPNREWLARTELFVQAMAQAVRVCVDHLGAEVTFLSLWPGRDEAMAARVMQAARKLGVPQDRMRAAREDLSVQDVATIVAQAGLLVSMRLHALIFAAGPGVPMLALAYARKVRGLMRTLGMERWVVEVETRTPSADEIEQKLHLLWEVRAEQAAAARAAAKQARASADADADRIAVVLAEITSRR